MTQIVKARKGIITGEMKTVAEKENVSPEFIAEGLIKGTIVIPKNNRRTFSCEGIGKGLRTKVNANIGTSAESCNHLKELSKLEAAVKCGAHSIMDLSTGGDLSMIRKTVIEKSPVMVGTVPLYEVFADKIRSGGKLKDITPDDFFSAVVRQVRDGVDFITVHCGVNQDLFRSYGSLKRVAGIVSRGGSLTKLWMTETGNENPYYEYFDRLLDIAYEYDVTLSLGDGMRPGGIADAGDGLQLKELKTLGSLVKRCRGKDVQVMVEGPGHVPINEIQFNMEIQKKMCDNAPFYVLGPLVCDVAPGYDHITAAIGGAVAASFGADFLCYVTPAEHLCLPDENDVRQGVTASVIAAHAGDIAKKVHGAAERNIRMSECRKNLDWDGMFLHAIDPETAKNRREASESAEKEYCSMCGDLCALRHEL
ncbi:MAG: phosphomethylpyrimidine synthase ThiC [Spirochaetes bacterium]|nr:phosphomethylpyrimidine synthase ThiC [Spirochaetota bacterium]